MDLQEEVRRRIADLTRSAYERGYRDGAQSALAEIEKISADDLADELKELPAALRVIGKKGASSERRPAPMKKPRKAEGKIKANGGAPKAVIVAKCIQELIASKGEARRDEVLAAARDENPRITGQDVVNGIRKLTKRNEIRVDPEEIGRLVPAELPAEQAVAG